MDNSQEIRDLYEANLHLVKDTVLSVTNPKAVPDPQFEFEDREMIDNNRMGKDNKWAYRKAQNAVIGDIFMELGVPLHTAIRYSDCAEVLLFEIANGTNEKRLRRTWFCKHKICPVCQWRKSLKQGYISEELVKRAMNTYRDENGKKLKGKFLFITLTVKNCDGADLHDTIKMILKGFDRMFRRALFRKHCHGFIRSLEVTYNYKTKQFHPHLHVLVFMKHSYFNSAYMLQEKWVEMWQTSAKLDYAPNVDVRRVRPRGNSKRSGIASAVAEVSKYPFKSIPLDNYPAKTQKHIVASLLKGLYRVKHVGYGGVFKEIYQQLKADEEDLLNVRDEEKSLGDDTRFQFAGFHYEDNKYYWMHKKD